MKTLRQISLGEMMASRAGSVDPSQHPNEAFDLYSIPAFDKREPDVLCGREIGSTKQVVRPGDVLLSKIVPHIRRSWVVGKDRGRRLIASSEWIVFRSNEFHSAYLRHVLTSDPFHAQFMGTVAGVGGSLLRARPAQVAALSIPLPPLPEQRRIAEVLDKANAIRQKRQHSTDLAMELLKSSYLHIFGNPRRRSKPWPLEPLGAACSVDRGKFTPRPRNDPKYYGGPHPFIQTGDISSSGGLLSKWKQTLNDEGVAVSRSFGPGTVVIAIVGATIGETAILTREMYCPDSVIGIVPHPDKVTSEYVEFTLRFFKQHFRDMAPETARANINLDTLRPLEVPIPPMPLQQQFSRIFQKCYGMKKRVVDPLDETDDLVNSLVQRAFRGEL